MRSSGGKISGALIFLLGLSMGSSCSTSLVEPEPIAAVPPAYAQLPHPASSDLTDLRQLFSDPQAPARDSEAMRSCAAAVVGLNAKAGVRALIRADSVRYHWCFYAKLLELEEDLRKGAFIDENQVAVIMAYLFIAPVARAFLEEFRDSRYLHEAIQRYRTVSERVFYRRVEPTPALTNQVTEAGAPIVGPPEAGEGPAFHPASRVPAAATNLRGVH